MRVVRLLIRVTEPHPFAPAVIQVNHVVEDGEEPVIGGRVAVKVEGEIMNVIPPMPG